LDQHQDGKKLFIFDSTYVPLKRSGHVDLSAGGHGWITFSRDGKYAWCHTPDVIDVRSRKVVATLKDDKDAPVSGSKFLEIDFQDGQSSGDGRSVWPRAGVSEINSAPAPACLF